jgi:hypothetical protein
MGTRLATTTDDNTKNWRMQSPGERVTERRL